MAVVRHSLCATTAATSCTLSSHIPDSLYPLIRLPTAVACLENDGFETPELNEKLYLHFCGFRRIENLEPYTALRALWLESNGLRTIEGLAHLSELRCLYLQQNAIARIEGLSSLTNLVTLNLSNNSITHIEGLSALPRLSSLNLAHNALASADAIAHLLDCKALTNVDLSDNLLPAGDDAEVVAAAIAAVMVTATPPPPALMEAGESGGAADTAAPPAAAAVAAPPPPPPAAAAAAAAAPPLDSDDEGDDAAEAQVPEDVITLAPATPSFAPAPPLVDPAAVAAAVAEAVGDADRAPTVLTILARMTGLSALYLKGNPLCRSTRNYRKVVLTMLPALTYLDDRPIFEVERVGTDAWATGGRDAEAQARQSFEAGQKAKERDNVEKFKAWQADIRARRANELEALNAERAGRGEAPLTELPRKSFVSYGRVSAKHHDEHIKLRRLMDRAEEVARTTGFHGTAMLDLGREWAAAEAKERGEEGGEEGGEGATASASTPSSAQVVAVPVLDASGKAIGVRYVDGEGRPVTEATDVYDDEIEAAAAAVQAPLPAGAVLDVQAAGEGSAGSAAAASAAAPPAGAAAKAPAAADEDEDEEDEEDEAVKPWQPAPRAAPEHDPLQLVQQSLKLFNIRLTKESAAAAAAAASISADGDSENAPPAASASVAPAEKAQSAVPASSTPSSGSSAPPAEALAPPPPPSVWTRSLDAALLKFVPQAGFDFGKVAKAIRNGVTRGVLSLGMPTTDALEEVLSEVACRERFATLSLSAPPAPAVAAPAAALVPAPAAVPAAAPLPPQQQEPAALPIPSRPVKPLSQLVRGEFRLPEEGGGLSSCSAVAPPMALPSLAATASATRAAAVAARPAAAPSGSEDDEDDEVVPLSREALLASLGSQYAALPVASAAGAAAVTDVDGLD